MVSYSHSQAFHAVKIDADTHTQILDNCYLTFSNNQFFGSDATGQLQMVNLRTMTGAVGVITGAWDSITNTLTNLVDSTVKTQETARVLDWQLSDILIAEPTRSNSPATRQYVDAATNLSLRSVGGTITGDSLTNYLTILSDWGVPANAYPVMTMMGSNDDLRVPEVIGRNTTQVWYRVKTGSGLSSNDFLTYLLPSIVSNQIYTSYVPPDTNYYDILTNMLTFMAYDTTNAAGHFLDTSTNAWAATNQPTAATGPVRLSYTNQYGRVNYVASFDGSDDWIRYNPSGIIATNTTNMFTVGTWILLGGDPGTSVIMGRYVNNSEGWGLAMDVPTALAPAFHTGAGWANSSVVLPTNQWVFLCVSVSNDTRRFFTNGVLASTRTDTDGAPSVMQIYAIGADSVGNASVQAWLDKTFIYPALLGSDVMTNEAAYGHPTNDLENLP